MQDCEYIIHLSHHPRNLAEHFGFHEYTPSAGHCSEWQPEHKESALVGALWTALFNQDSVCVIYTAPLTVRPTYRKLLALNKGLPEGLQQGYDIHLGKLAFPVGSVIHTTSNSCTKATGLSYLGVMRSSTPPTSLRQQLNTDGVFEVFDFVIDSVD